MVASDATRKTPYYHKGVFSFNMTNYDKPFKNYKELIELLESRNIYIPKHDKERAIEILSDVSYYSLINGNKSLFPKDSSDNFLVPVNFMEFYLLYNFDTQINSIIFKYIIEIEKSLKSKLSYIISENFGVFTNLDDNKNLNKDDYLCKKNYKNDKSSPNILSSLKREVLKSKNESVIHYKDKHNHIPCWILLNGISFGLTIKLYQILKPKHKEYVCDKIMKTKLLSIEDKKELLIKSLIILRRYRNKIAHGHKVFTNSIKEELPKRQVLKIANELIDDNDYKKGLGKNDIFAVILIIYVLSNDLNKKIFIREIIGAFELYAGFTFSTNKNIYELISLPTDFIDRLKKLEE